MTDNWLKVGFHCYTLAKGPMRNFKQESWHCATSKSVVMWQLPKYLSACEDSGSCFKKEYRVGEGLKNDECIGHSVQEDTQGLEPTQFKQR